MGEERIELSMFTTWERFYRPPTHSQQCPLSPKQVSPACIHIYRAMLDTDSPYKPPSTAQQSLNYFRRISKASRILQSLNFSYLLWIKFFVGFIALQDFKPTMSGFFAESFYSLTYILQRTQRNQTISHIVPMSLYTAFG